MLGSDYPFPLGEHHPGKLIESMEEFSSDLKVTHNFSNIFFMSAILSVS